MRILGIDPGLRLTGYSLVEIRAGQLEPALVEGGVLRLVTTGTMEDRLARLHDEIIALIDELHPQRMAIEKLYAHYKHPRTAILMAHARGVILLAGRQKGLQIAHLPATEVKKAITGYGHATKEQIQLAVQTQCRLSQPPSPPDVADAIAIALTDARQVALAHLRA